mgnify:CR=1 FL=1
MNGIIDTMNTTWMDIAQKRDCDLHCTMEFVIIETKKLKNINWRKSIKVYQMITAI